MADELVCTLKERIESIGWLPCLAVNVVCIACYGQPTISWLSGYCIARYASILVNEIDKVHAVWWPANSDHLRTELSIQSPDHCFGHKG